MPKILLASSQYRFIGSKKLGTLGDAYHMIEMVRLRMYNLIAPNVQQVTRRITPFF